MLESFFQHFPITKSEAISPQFIESFAGKVPGSVLDFWKEYGRPVCGDGIVRFVDPQVFQSALAKWVPARPGRAYTPFAITGFGELFYIRKLGDSDVVPEGKEGFDLYQLDPHYRGLLFSGWDVLEAMDAFDPSKEPNRDTFNFAPDFRPSLFADALAAMGPLEDNEAFHFAPALSAGGVEEMQFIKKGDAAVHLELLYPMG